MSQDQTKTTKFSRSERVLWWCSGADKDLLMESCPPSDRVKYYGMGGVVLATGILAFISSSYAFYTIFAPKGDAIKSTAQGLVDFGEGVDTLSAVLSLLFGLFWGFMIFNLDRFIVSSGGKGDMKEGLGLKDLRDSWPRFLMAILLGIIISKPLEVRIMKTEIDAELSTRQEIYEAEQNKLSDKLIDAEITTLRAYVTPLQKSITDNQAYIEKRRLEIKDQRKTLELEAEGKTASGIAGRGPAWRDKKENLDKMEGELEQLAIKYANNEQELKQRIQDYDKQIAQKEEGRDERHKKNKQKADQMDGLVERIKIGDEKYRYISIFLSLMFIIIEITPLLFKMMMTKTPYDYLSENKNKLILANHGIAFLNEPHRDGSGKEVEIISYQDSDRINYKKQKETEIIKQQIDNYTPGQ